MYSVITRPHVRPLHCLRKVTIPASGSAVICTDFRMLELIEGFRVVVASSLKDVGLRPQHPVSHDGESYVGLLDKDTPLQMLAVNHNSFNVEVNMTDEFGFIGVEEEDDPGWVESQVSSRSPTCAEEELTIATAVLPDDVSAFFNRNNLKDFDCTALKSEFFWKECLPQVFTVLQRRGWPFGNYSKGDYALAEISECIDMAKL